MTRAGSGEVLAALRKRRRRQRRRQRRPAAWRKTGRLPSRRTAVAKEKMAEASAVSRRGLCGCRAPVFLPLLQGRGQPRITGKSPVPLPSGDPSPDSSPDGLEWGVKPHTTPIHLTSSQYPAARASRPRLRNSARMFHLPSLSPVLTSSSHPPPPALHF